MFEKKEENSWISISDLMSGLMLVFLFIAVIYMQNIAKEKSQIKQIVVAWKETENQIYHALQEEFEKDLPVWKAEIDQTNLIFRFKSPEILFAPMSAELKPQFQMILNDFFPRYLKTLAPFIENIEEVRIEGHTSSEWKGSQTEEAYFKNMNLSQDRTQAVWEYVMSQQQVNLYKHPIKQKITASGLSSSRIIQNTQGQEDREKSRRVEFRVMTHTKKQIVNILQTIR